MVNANKWTMIPPDIIYNYELAIPTTKPKLANVRPVSVSLSLTGFSATLLEKGKKNISKKKKGKINQKKGNQATVKSLMSPHFCGDCAHLNSTQLILRRGCPHSSSKRAQSNSPYLEKILIKPCTFRASDSVQTHKAPVWSLCRAV